MTFREFLNESKFNIKSAKKILDNIEVDWEDYGKKGNEASQIIDWANQTEMNFGDDEISEMIGIKSKDVNNFLDFVRDNALELSLKPGQIFISPDGESELKLIKQKNDSFETFFIKHPFFKGETQLTKINFLINPKMFIRKS